MLSLYSRASLEALLEMLWRCVVDTDTQCPLQLPSRHFSFLQEHHSLTDPPRCIHCEGSHALPWPSEPEHTWLVQGWVSNSGWTNEKLCFRRNYPDTVRLCMQVNKPIVSQSKIHPGTVTTGQELSWYHLQNVWQIGCWISVTEIIKINTYAFCGI